MKKNKRTKFYNKIVKDFLRSKKIYPDFFVLNQYETPQSMYEMNRWLEKGIEISVKRKIENNNVCGLFKNFLK